MNDEDIIAVLVDRAQTLRRAIIEAESRIESDGEGWRERVNGYMIRSMELQNIADALGCSADVHRALTGRDV